MRLHFHCLIFEWIWGMVWYNSNGLRHLIIWKLLTLVLTLAPTTKTIFHSPKVDVPPAPTTEKASPLSRSQQSSPKQSSRCWWSCRFEGVWTFTSPGHSWYTWRWSQKATVQLRRRRRGGVRQGPTEVRQRVEARWWQLGPSPQNRGYQSWTGLLIL